MAVIVTEHFDKGDILYTREEVDVRRMRTPYKSEFFSGPMYSYFALIKRVDFIPQFSGSGREKRNDLFLRYGGNFKNLGILESRTQAFHSFRDVPYGEPSYSFGQQTYRERHCNLGTSYLYVQFSEKYSTQKGEVFFLFK